MLTKTQQAAVAAYHWWSSFIEAIAEHREVWFITTHQRTKLVTYQ